MINEVKFNKKPVYSFFKRLLDIVFSLICIIMLGIPMLIIAIIIKCDSKGPVLFKQNRIGKNKKKFIILKFRSMYINTNPNAPTHQLDNANSHITKIGSFIRKTSIDELPQLFNILMGSMSFVGPRPALWNQNDLIEERDKYHANNIKPGLTGLAQISGRDELEISLKAELDGQYVEKRNLFFDIMIILKTILAVFRHEGIVEGGTGALNKKNEEREKIINE